MARYRSPNICPVRLHGTGPARFLSKDARPHPIPTDLLCDIALKSKQPRKTFAEGCSRQEYSSRLIQVTEAGKPQMSELWAKWEGEVINGGLPLRRLVGVSDHSGVFLTEAPTYGLPTAAVKLVPAIPTLAESQLAHWNAAAGLAHPRLLRLFAMGRCQLGNLHFLFVLMEYADQNLAQLLENRALTDVEARETLPPTLDALAFLHSRNLVQGQLKPSNILVVGDQLKLASDTIRPASEQATSISMSSQYDPPEGRDGSFSTAGDIWALGVLLYEALTRSTPAKPDERSHGVVLPADFPATLADVTRECLSRRPADRPSVTALQDWVSGKVKYRGAPSASTAAAATNVVRDDPRTGGGSARSETAPASYDGQRAGADVAATHVAHDGQRATASTATTGVALDSQRTSAPPGTAASGTNYRGATAPDRTPPQRGASQTAAAFSPATPAPAGAAAPRTPGKLTIRAVVEREPIEEEPPTRPSYTPWVVAGLVILAIGWGAVRLLGGHSSSSPSSTTAEPSTNASQPAPQSGDSPTQTQSVPGPEASKPAPSEQAPPLASSETRRHSSSGTNRTPRGEAPGAGPGSVAHEEIPVVPRSALSTIHGRIKVVVRVTADESGNVISDNLDHPGPSNYFAKVAAQAARKWKFVPDGHKSGGVWLIHFEFARTGTTAHATGAKS
jgi:hypothetical protein